MLIFPACMFTEWWDLDDPCAKGEVEAVILSHTYAKMIGEPVRHGPLRAAPSNKLDLLAMKMHIFHKLAG